MKTIIVPTDFSPAADNAVDYAVELAKFFNAKIVLVNACSVPVSSYESGYAVDITPSVMESSYGKLMKLKRAILKNKDVKLEIECIAEIGSPYEVINSVTDDEDGDVIVMGIVGEAGKLKKNLIGSTAIEVARKKTVPTFIIPESVEYKKIAKTSYACDLNNEEGLNLVYLAKYFAKIFGAELEIVNVEKPEELTTKERVREKNVVENRLKNVIHNTVYITGDDVVAQLENHFLVNRPDLIMLNPKKHNLFYYMFNQSITKELAFDLNLPILALH